MRGHRAAYRELMESLWYAAKVFKEKGDGGHEGAKLAGHAVIRLLGVRHENPELAAPFLALHAAISDLQQGLDPELFSRSKEGRKRSRSRQRKHAQLFAAACMEALMRLGDSQESAARRVSRYAPEWPSLKGADVDHTTIRNWRDKAHSSAGSQLEQFELICSDLVTRHDPRRYIDYWLRAGPPGVPSSLSIDSIDPSVE
jgi:hypothetical protein